MKLIPVPYGLNVSVRIRREGDTAFVEVHAPMYTNKFWVMPHQYSTMFSDYEILKDHNFTTTMLDHYPAN